MSHLLNRDALLALQDIKSEDIFVEEWQATVRIRELSASAREKFLSSLAREENGKRVPNTDNINARLAAICLVNPDGTMMFAEHEAAILGSKSAKAIEFIFKKANELNKLFVDQVDKEVKNSEGEESAGSSSASA